jgi:hypothetical protein
MRALVAAALLLAALLAGCAGQDSDLFASQQDKTHRFDGPLTFLPPVATNGSGAFVPLPAWAADPATAPHVVERMLGLSGAEPNVGVTSKGSIFVNTLDQTQRSRDHGATWEVAYDYATPGGPVVEDMFSTLDPMLWVDPDTDRVFVSQMQGLTPVGLCSYLVWSDDDGDTWFERPAGCGYPHIDHQKVVTAHYGPGMPAPPNPVYPNVLYMCTNDQEIGTWCVESLDGGLTFGGQQQVSPQDALCANINGHPVAWPDGTVAVPLGGGLGGPDCKRPPTLYVTETNGQGVPAFDLQGVATPNAVPGWTYRSCAPGFGQTEIDPDLTVTPDGTAYMMFRGADQLHHLLRSKDKFQTCDVFKVSPPDVTLSVFAGLASGADGRLAMAWLGTKDPQEPGATPSNATGGSVWHAYETFVLDAESADPTFVHVQVTPVQDPVQVGCVWLGGGGGGPQACRNLLDFIDAVADKDGRTYVAITDGCSPRNGCTGDVESIGFQSRDRDVAVLVLDSGLGLKGDVPLPALGLQPPYPFPE